MTGPLDVLSVSDTCVDLIVTGNVRPKFGQVEQLVDDYAVDVGGSAPIFASQFVKLGGRAGLVGALGDDPFGRLALERLRSVGVDTSRLDVRREVKTALGLGLSEPGDRAMLTYLGSIDALGPEALTEELLRACRHWHLASYFLLAKLRGAWREWLRRARQAGLSTSLDTNWDPANRWEGVRELLPFVQVFLPNEAEAQAIAREKDVYRAGAALAREGPLVVVKRGERGAAAFDGVKSWEVPDPADVNVPLRVVDTTGAGDSFDAGFLRAWLLRRPVEDCLRWGMRCGRASLAAAGGIEAQLRRRVDG